MKRKGFIRLVLITAVTLFSINLLAQEEYVNIGQELEGGFSFGQKISLDDSGKILAVACRDYNNYTGIAIIYEYNGVAWEQLGDTIFGNAEEANFGRSISLSKNGKVIAIAGLSNIDNKGYVKVFEYVENNWVQKGSTIIATYADSEFGYSISLNYNGEYLVIGAPTKWSRGTVRLYRHMEMGNSWVPVGNELTGSYPGDRFGNSVDIDSSGIKIAVGAPEHDGTNQTYNNIGAGSLYHLDENSMTWILRAYISYPVNNIQNGYTVRISNDGNTIATAAPFYSGSATNGGQISVYTFTGTSLIQKGLILRSNIANAKMGEYFDFSGNGNTIVTVRNQNKISTFDFINNTWQYRTSDFTIANCHYSIHVALNQDGKSLSYHRYYSGAGYVQNSIFTCDKYRTKSVESCESFTSPTGNYTWYESGSYVDTIEYTESCDSIIIFDLTINHPTETYDTIYVCENELAVFHDGNTNPVSLFYDTHHTSILETQNGCDSTIHTTAKALEIYETNENATICIGESYQFPDENIVFSINEDLVYQSILTSVKGCDSIVNTSMSVTNAKFIFDTSYVCPGSDFTFADGHTEYNITNEMQHVSTVTLPTGCDSIVNTTIKLKMNPLIYLEGISLIATENNATYQWIKCGETNMNIEGETNKVFTPLEAGNYGVILNNGECTYTTECENIIITSTTNSINNEISIFPNPVNDKLFISGNSIERVELYNFSGQLINSQSNLIINTQIFDPGIYIIKVYHSTGITSKKLIIE